MRRSTSATKAPRTRAGVWLGCLIALALSTGCESCQSAPDNYGDINQQVSEGLSRVGLGPGDVFEVAVFGEPSLSGTHRISPDGAIHFPLIKRVVVEGMTPSDIAEILQERLRDGYLRDPSVSVLVKEYNSKKIFVLGQVAKPGTFAYTANMNIVEAIALAGGLRETAQANYVIVTRGDQRLPVPVERITEGKAANLNIQPGDIIFVPDKLL